MHFNSLLKNPKIPHATGAKGAKFAEENPLCVLCDLCVRLFQQAVTWVGFRAPTVRTMPAQGNALGNRMKNKQSPEGA